MAESSRGRQLAFLLTAIISLTGFPAGSRAQSNSELVSRGRYIFAVAGGCACHTDPKGTPHAGGRSFPIPFGTVYSTNITADKATGLGAWTDQQIYDAMVKGIRNDGTRILPVMPYEKYSGMAQDDLKALIAYLRTLKPVKKATPELKSRVPFLRTLATPIYLQLFGKFASAPVTAPEKGIQRGRYLVDHVAICGDCHTPRNSIGVPNESLYMAGVTQDNGPLGEAVANITPDKETGIGDWRREDIAELLRTGIKPDGDNVQGLMAEVIEGTPHGYKELTKEDALAVADYIKSITPIRNQVR